MAKKNMTVETLIYKDVRGKELMYLRIQTTTWNTDKTGKKEQITNEVLINVGDKTYKSVEDLINKQDTDERLTKIEGVLGK